MRLYVWLCVISICFLPGCPFGSTPRSSSSSSSSSSWFGGNRVAHGIDAYDIEELEFEEDADDITTPVAHAQVELVEEPTHSTYVQDRHLEQAKYGFKPIYFTFNQYALREDQHDTLEHNLKAISRITKGKKGRRGTTIVIEGHACRFAGSPEYNMQLSEKRAQAVKDYLVDHGIPANKLHVVGRGHTMCIVPSGNKEQQAPNRRVEFHVLE